MTWLLRFATPSEARSLFSADAITVYAGARLIRCPSCLRKKRYDARPVGDGWLAMDRVIECPNLDCGVSYDPMTEQLLPVRPFVEFRGVRYIEEEIRCRLPLGVVRHPWASVLGPIGPA